MENQKYFFVNGGIGDFLQCLPFMLLNREENYIVNSHFKNAPAFFNAFDLEKIQFLKFNNVEELKSNYASLDPATTLECPRYVFGRFNFGMHHEIQVEQKIDQFKDSKKPIIAIHPFGSSFANEVYKQIANETKNISKEIVKELIKPSFNYFIFGSEQEISTLDIPESENVKHISFKNILTSLSAVRYCDQLIGADSCFKTASSMQNIKTTCLISSIEDHIRDKFFLDPYVENGVMTVLKIQNEIDKLTKTVYEKYNTNF